LALFDRGFFFVSTGSPTDTAKEDRVVPSFAVTLAVFAVKEDRVVLGGRFWFGAPLFFARWPVALLGTGSLLPSLSFFALASASFTMGGGGFFRFVSFFCAKPDTAKHNPTINSNVSFLFYVKELADNYLVRFSRPSLEDEIIRIFQPVLTVAAEVSWLLPFSFQFFTRLAAVLNSARSIC
jgi:hypothetical protein